MKVGVLQFFSWSRRIPLAEVYRRAMTRIQIMERTGYDCVWLAEHHFNTYTVLEAWRSEKLTYDGRFWSFRDIEVLPNPTQAPHPPVWLAATSRESIERAAEKGFDILRDPHSTNDDIVHGSPERVVDRLMELRERIGLDYLMCAPLSQQTFTLFTEKVLPKLL